MFYIYFWHLQQKIIFDECILHVAQLHLVHISLVFSLSDLGLFSMTTALSSDICTFLSKTIVRNAIGMSRGKFSILIIRIESFRIKDFPNRTTNCRRVNFVGGLEHELIIGSFNTAYQLLKSDDSRHASNNITTPYTRSSRCTINPFTYIYFDRDKNHIGLARVSEEIFVSLPLSTASCCSSHDRFQTRLVVFVI